MVDITHKDHTLREATARAVVTTGSGETIDRVKNDRVPKGNLFATARAAALLGIKKTPDLLPGCHPLPIEYADVEFEIREQQILITMKVKTIYKTGVEVEAMHGASVAALTVYDMLKPIDGNVGIGSIRLLRKSGGSSSSFTPSAEGVTARVVVCSDSVSRGESEDSAGREIVRKLEELGVPSRYTVIPDEAGEIKRQLGQQAEELLIFTGGTGAGPRDVTPETIRPLLDTPLPGVEEQMRRYGQQRTPYAMLSRSVAGLREGKVVLAFPGSTRGASECVDALFPGLLHIFEMIKGRRHE